MPLTKKDLILGRLPKGIAFVKRGLSERDNAACKRFLDGSEYGATLLGISDYDGIGILPASQETGSVNYLAINIATKVASIAIGDPDFHVEATDDPMMEADPPNKEIARRFLKSLWKAKQWARVSRKALLKRSLSGLGIVAYLWDAEKGPVFEHVRAADFAIDPNVIDWNGPRWAARRIYLPKDEAEERWPGHDFDVMQEKGQSQKGFPSLDAAPEWKRTDVVELWCYWDALTEAVVYGDVVLEHDDNLYGKIPLLTLEGDLAPESEFSLGDYDGATGLQAMLARLQAAINDQAEHGGAIPWYNPALLGDAGKEALADGHPSGWLPTQSDPADGAFGIIPSTPINPALLEAFSMVQKGLDSFTGVNEYQRGVISQGAEFATEAALLAQQSGARGNQSRIEFEQFVDRMARAVIDLMVKFGPSLADQFDENDGRLLQACAAVTDICVIESSTTYKNPAYEMQAAIQLVTSLMPFIQLGIINPQKAATKLIQASGERDAASWLMPLMPPQASVPGLPVPGAEGTPQGGGEPPPQGQGSTEPPPLRLVGNGGGTGNGGLQ
jgi:hypothetical protein